MEEFYIVKNWTGIAVGESGLIKERICESLVDEYEGRTYYKSVHQHGIALLLQGKQHAHPQMDSIC